MASFCRPAAIKKKSLKMVRESGVEPGSIAWKATMLPLYHSRSCLAYFFYLIYTSRNITHDILQPGVTLRGDKATRCVDCGFVRLRTKIRTYSAWIIIMHLSVAANANSRRSISWRLDYCNCVWRLQKVQSVQNAATDSDGKSVSFNHPSYYLTIGQRAFSWSSVFIWNSIPLSLLETLLPSVHSNAS